LLQPYLPWLTVHSVQFWPSLSTYPQLLQAINALEISSIWIAVWLTVRYPFYTTFKRLTVHRGLWHSLLMSCAVALTVVVISAHWLHQSELIAWLAGGFVWLGYITHLTLDEFASVDLTNLTVKRSFGSALKLLSLKNWSGSALLIGFSVWLYHYIPDPAVLIQLWTSLNN
jgi:hypothetical protein